MAVADQIRPPLKIGTFLGISAASVIGPGPIAIRPSYRGDRGQFGPARGPLQRGACGETEIPPGYARHRFSTSDFAAVSCDYEREMAAPRRREGACAIKGQIGRAIAGLVSQACWRAVNRSDNRDVPVSLTRTGLTAHVVIMAGALKRSQRLLDGLGKEEVTTLLTQIERLTCGRRDACRGADVMIPHSLAANGGFHDFRSKSGTGIMALLAPTKFRRRHTWWTGRARPIHP
jgi:hypothetical protein